MNHEFFQDLQFARAQNRSVMIEGIPPNEYQSLLDLVSGPNIRDFRKLLGLPEGELESQLEGNEYLVLSHVDLLGNGIDSDEATRVMHVLRNYCQHKDMSQLMLARPGADLDFRKVQRFCPPYHHPLGNWCEFYTYEEGRLRQQSGPVKHRD
jgi:hypothetical protein